MRTILPACRHHSERFRTAGDASPLAPYLEILREKEAIPLVWTPEESAELLRDTELHDTVREDTAVMMVGNRDNDRRIRVSGRKRARTLI